MASAIGHEELLAAIGRYSLSVKHELAVTRSFGNGVQSQFTLAWWIVSALKIRTLVDLLIPVVSDRSWSTMEPRIAWKYPPNSRNMMLVISRRDLGRECRTQTSVRGARGRYDVFDPNCLRWRTRSLIQSMGSSTSRLMSVE